MSTVSNPIRTYERESVKTLPFLIKPQKTLYIYLWTL